MTGGDRLTLRQALDEDRLPEFVAQAEADGVPAADREAFERAMRAAIKPVKSAGRTLRSRTGGDSTGSRTQRGKRASVSR
jgi:hypothetical protein